MEIIFFIWRFKRCKDSWNAILLDECIVVCVSFLSFSLCKLLILEKTLENFFKVWIYIYLGHPNFNSHLSTTLSHNHNERWMDIFILIYCLAAIAVLLCSVIPHYLISFENIAIVKCEQLSLTLSILTASNTALRNYHFLRLPFGLNLQDDFQRQMDEIFEGSPGIVSFADDSAPPVMYTILTWAVNAV